MVGEDGRRASRREGVDRPESPLELLPILVLYGESTLRDPTSPRINRSNLSRQAFCNKIELVHVQDCSTCSRLFQIKNREILLYNYPIIIT